MSPFLAFAEPSMTKHGPAIWFLFPLMIIGVALTVLAGVLAMLADDNNKPVWKAVAITVAFVLAAATLYLAAFFFHQMNINCDPNTNGLCGA